MKISIKYFSHRNKNVSTESTELPVPVKQAMLKLNRTFICAVLYQSINQFSGPAYPWGVAGAAAQVGASKHLDPLQQKIDALLGCQGETN